MGSAGVPPAVAGASSPPAACAISAGVTINRNLIPDLV